MKKKNIYATGEMSFADFEQAMMTGRAAETPLDELVKDRLEQEKEARKKETALKKAHRKTRQLKK